MRYKFKAEPNLVLTVNMEKFILRFDEQGELVLSDDHPALERLKTRFPFEEAEKGEATDNLLTCRKCGFKCETKPQMMQHHKQEHPKEG